MKTRRTNGFTLLELLITLAVAAVLATIAIPNFRSFLQNNDMTTSVRALQSDIQLARSEAIRRNQQTMVCPSDVAGNCTGTDWTGNRAVRAVINASSSELVRVSDPVGSLVSMVTGPATIYFNSSGQLSIPATVRFSLKNATDSTNSRQLTVMATGRSDVAKCSWSCS